MTLHYLPTATTTEGREPDPAQAPPFGLTDPAEFANEPGEREPWKGEAEALAEAAAVGRRAAEWIRALPLPLPDGAWICGPLADAVEEAMTTLDPADCDDADRFGHGGVSESARQRLDGLVYDVAAVVSLTAAQKTALFAVIHCVQGTPKSLANDPGTVIERGDLAAVCEIIRSAIGGAQASEA
ncbi:hypothetical protein [Streptomyces vietnamensis]|uniref:Uncharacterized protein n=1 Tax=Streptomyces vietnamensis TaxID=362257 RepID=A0A0B5III2_9ACTN|nr:hypothetical protein [Streptomyces vietnamensis]AJF70307.1 hypothetical protein SVTN_39445 [Streptomyces vietnamensis]